MGEVNFMKIQTLSIVVGTRACNAGCPFCVSRMTGFDEIPKRGAIYHPNFAKACRLAQLAGTTTVLMTGKGEPTLYPYEITEYLDALAQWNFPMIELQTNALDIGWLAWEGVSRDSRKLTRETLVGWRARGLNTIAISTVSEQSEHNTEVYLCQSRYKDYPDLPTTMRFLHDLGFTVRICVMLQKKAVDTPMRVQELIAYWKKYNADQLTIRPIRKPVVKNNDHDTTKFVIDRGLDEDEISAIRVWVETHGTRLMSLMHGAVIYDIEGINCCLSDCLTLDGCDSDVRTLIFYSDGRLTYDWQYPGAIILRGVSEALRVKTL